MATQVEVINLALGHLAQAPISSISEASVQAQTAVRVWDSCRKECLRGHDWAFGTVVATLSLSATYGTLSTSGLYAGDWLYAYVYPPSCLAMWHVYNENTIDKNHSEEFRELYDPINSSKVILTNTQNALGEYTFDVIDPQFYDASFVPVFALRLAVDMAMPLTGDPQLRLTMVKAFTEAMNDAERMSAYESNPDQVRDGSSSFIDSRGGSTDANSYFNPNNPHING